MNGAQSLVRTLVRCGVDVCFMNPGTSEMHFVATLDAVPEMRGVLTLFEGVATGAADGYGRMAGRPAATLLHLGPGLSNGVANLHNARRARTPIINVVGDHATYHKKFDPPLESDIEGIARNVSPGFVRWGTAPETLGADTVLAYRAAMGPPGQVATIVVPADISWGAGGVVAPAPLPLPQPSVDAARVTLVADVVRSGTPTALLLGNHALTAGAIDLASRVARATGVRLLCETFPARIQRGAGIPAVERIAYLGEMAAAQLEGLRHLVLVDAKPPVSFFAYPEQPSWLLPDGCEVHVLSGPTDDTATTLAALVHELGAEHAEASPADAVRPGLPGGELTAAAVAEAIGALMPEGAIVSDESNTSGLFTAQATAGCPPHDWLYLTGGAIGQGLPVAVGAAVACPDRRVLALEADGSSLYTLQSWWTMAREGLDVTTVLFNNHSYAILNMELQRVGTEGAGELARDMLDLSGPDIDYASLARGLGLSAWRSTTAEEFGAHLGEALATSGPSLVEAVLPKHPRPH
jgi:acetolactate synthase I/II/III large subunit